jgi:hypothetical protein
MIVKEKQFTWRQWSAGNPQGNGLSLKVCNRQENYFPWRLLALSKTSFLRGCWHLVKLISLEVTGTQEN